MSGSWLPCSIWEGTFDTALVRRTDPSSYEVEGRAIGLERLGGVDLDQALFDHVVDTLDLDLAELPDTPTTLAAVVQLRDDVIGAKEQLSFDSSTVVPVMLEGRQTQVRLTRSEFETLARPFIDRAVDSLEEAIDTAGIARGQVDVIVPVGGTSRVPLVAERLSSRLGIPIASATNPRHAVALGAVVASSPPEPSSADLDEESPSLVDDRSLVVAAAATSADAPTAAELPPPAAEPPSLPPAGDSAAVVEPVDVVAGGGPTRSSRLLLVGALAVLVLAVVGVWQLIGDRDAGGDDVSATGGVEASDDGETDQREATGEVPSTGFEIENPVGNGYQSSAFGLPLADSGPSRLPQQLWQNQVPGMFQTPVGSGGVLVASGAEQVGDRYLSRLTAIDPSTGAEVWRHETIDFLHAYFVGDGAVVGLFQVDPLVHDAEAIEPLRLDAVLIDLTTGNRSRGSTSPLHRSTWG
ncbi:MAG: Hsp70 family protein [Acidimicrobiales bacterium]